jgi:hypothetical protein
MAGGVSRRTHPIFFIKNNTMNNYKKYITVFIFALVIVVFFYFLYPTSNAVSLQSKPTADLRQDIACKLFLKFVVGLPDSATTTDFTDWLTYHDPNDWLTYHDQKYHFRIDYPCDLHMSREGDRVSFSTDLTIPGPGSVGSSVTVEPTTSATPEEWVAQINKSSPSPLWVVDGTITINGYTGIVGHGIGATDGSLSPKSILFIKGGNLFTIYDTTMDYLRTWTSFHFE